jgi:hypothetical protein
MRVLYGNFNSASSGDSETVFFIHYTSRFMLSSSCLSFLTLIDNTLGYIILLMLYPIEVEETSQYSSMTLAFYQNDLAIRNTAAVISPSPSDRSLSQVLVLLIL